MPFGDIHAWDTLFVNSKKDSFSVAIIPYTYENTIFHTFEIGTKVNLEFDVVGKYIARMYELQK